jgi:hypothetical protein
MALKYVMTTEKRTEVVNLNVKTGVALSDLNGLLTAALCVVRFDEDYTDMDEEDKKRAVETLLEFSRSVLDDATEGHEEVWKFLSHFVHATTEDTAPATEQAEQPA